MSTATTFLKSNYLDKVNKLTKNGNENTRHSIKQITSVRYYIKFKFTLHNFRNETSIEYHRSFDIFNYNLLYCGSVYITLSTNEKASETSWCHTSGKYQFKFEIWFYENIEIEREILWEWNGFLIFLSHIFLLQKCRVYASRTIRILTKRNLRVANGHRIW